MSYDFDDFAASARWLRRRRFWLIVTGIPIAMAFAGLGAWLNPFAAILTVLGSWVGIRTLDLLLEARKPDWF